MRHLFLTALGLLGVLLAPPAGAQSANPWAVPRAPAPVPGQVLASSSGAISQNFYTAPNTGLVSRQPGISGSAGGGIPFGYGDYPPLDGLPDPAPAAPYAGAPRMAPAQPPFTGPTVTPYGQPYAGFQPYAGTPYAYAPYGALNGYPAYGGGYGYPAYGGMPYGGAPFGAPFGGFPGFGGMGGLPGGIYPGGSGMFGTPFGGANLTPWGMGSPWMW